VAWLIIAYVVLHIVAQLGLGGFRQLLKILNPRAAYGMAAVTALGMALLIGAGVYALDQVTIRDLSVARTDTPPIIDGDPSDEIWRVAKAVDIATNRGVNQPGGEVTVTVRMLHDGESIYALFEWPDSTRSQKHLPLQKTALGWRVVQKEYGVPIRLMQTPTTCRVCRWKILGNQGLIEL
jgi:hypothetical protein